MWGLLLTVLAIWPYAMTSSFYIKKKYENILIAFMRLSRVAHGEEGGMQHDPMRKRRRREPAALSTQRGAWDACRMVSEQLPWSRSRSRETSLHPKYCFPSWEQVPQISFYRTWMSSLNQRPIASMQQRRGTWICCPRCVQISTPALTNCVTWISDITPLMSCFPSWKIGISVPPVQGHMRIRHNGWITPGLY